MNRLSTDLTISYDSWGKIVRRGYPSFVALMKAHDAELREMTLREVGKWIEANKGEGYCNEPCCYITTEKLKALKQGTFPEEGKD